MKINFLLIFLLFFSVANAQLQPETALECNSSKDIMGTSQTSYYQYSSMNRYDIKYLKLDLSVEPNSRTISGNAFTTAKTVAVMDTFIIEFKNNMIVDSVLINGNRRLFTHTADHLLVPIPTAIPPGTLFNVHVYYQGNVVKGLFTGTVASNGLIYTATLSESFQAREWFPAKQILTDKIDSADLWFTTSATNKVGSNGLLKAVVPVAGGKLQYQWKERYPMNYYMPSFSVGNYMEYINYAHPADMSPDSLPIQHYIVNNASYFNEVKANLDKTPPFLEKMSGLFGPYPFKKEKYGHAHAAIGGGMEHQTMSTMAGFTTGLIAHELGHMWWGDNVTCASWNHIWLNEGFASYCEYLVIENLPLLFPGVNPADNMQNFHNSAMSAPGGSVFVPDGSVYDEGRIFNSRLSYAKGAAIIHSLRFEMQSDTLFFRTLRNFQQQYKDSVATAEDFKRVAESVAGKSLNDFFNQWYYGEGYPTFNVTFFKEGSNVLLLKINQTASMPAITPFFKGFYEFKVTHAQGDTLLKIYLSANNEEFRFNFNKSPLDIIVDPRNWVLNRTGTIVNGGVIVPTVPPVPPSQVTLSVNAVQACNIQLNWLTSNEHNILKYAVEYSADNTSFVKVGEVAGTNTNTNQLHNFTYRPAGNTGTHFFRLVIIDSQMVGRFSNTISQAISCNTVTTYTVRTGPGPSPGTLNVYISSPVKENAFIRMSNALSEIVFKKEIVLQPGESVIPIDIMQKLPAGTYVLQVVTGAHKFTKIITRL